MKGGVSVGWGVVIGDGTGFDRGIGGEVYSDVGDEVGEVVEL